MACRRGNSYEYAIDRPADAWKQPGAGDAVKALLEKQGKPTNPGPVGSIKNVAFPAAAGGNLLARVYTPKGDGPFPVLVYWHGGGLVLGDLSTYDSSCRALCNAANCMVVSCEYRHAPEHPFPAAADDTFAAYQWVLANAGTLNGDPKKVAVGGESAAAIRVGRTPTRSRTGRPTTPGCRRRRSSPPRSTRYGTTARSTRTNSGRPG